MTDSAVQWFILNPLYVVGYVLLAFVQLCSLLLYMFFTNGSAISKPRRRRY